MRVTSVEAHEAIAGFKSELQESVYNCIANTSSLGLTDEEVQDRLGMNPSTQRPRRLELVDAGLVIDSGRRRKTRSGRNAIVWTVTNVNPYIKER